MKNDPKDQNKFFSDEIIKWYEDNGRNNLPWRNNVTAYKVWISEIMLQQTQVKTVIPFFNAFVKKYPNLKSLSLASEENYIFKVNSSWILEDDEIRRPYDLNESF